MIWVRSTLLATMTLLSGVISGSGLAAQSTPATAPSVAPPAATSRAQLREQLRAADSLGRKEEAFLLRTRLQNGDFEVGDRIAITYQVVGFEHTRDTAVVQQGRILRLPEPLGDVDLTGMLRFELPDTVTGRVTKYYRQAVVHVTPLLRLSISGAVRQGGFYYVPPDSPLSDLIMRTGGQDASADLDNVVIRRGDEVLWSKEDVQSALGDGVTLERLNLQPGDEILVGFKHHSPWLAILQYGLGLTGLIVSLWRIR